jgi:predicted RNA-binding Zn-ribbon protein involved in translation (DUF1610 family)
VNNTDNNQLFLCPECGSPGEIYLLKIDGPQIIVKQRCPNHGGRSFRVPLRDLKHYLSSIRDGVFRCYECGKRAAPGPVKLRGPYAILNCVCQMGHSQKTQKIWSTVFLEITNPSLEKPQQPKKYDNAPTEAKTPEKKQETTNFCPNCGTKLEGNEKFCGICGTKLDL